MDMDALTPNLIFRGKTFFWRARLPKTVAATSGARQVCLRLETSDVREANRMAVELNQLRDEIACVPVVRPLSEEELACIFEHELSRFRARMQCLRAWLLDLGHAHDPSNSVDDYVFGWVWRLYADLGPNVSLTFDRDCPGMRYLFSRGVRREHVPAIIRELKANRSDAHSTKRKAKALLESKGYPAHDLAQVQAAARMLAARADAVSAGADWPIVGIQPGDQLFAAWWSEDKTVHDDNTTAQAEKRPDVVSIAGDAVSPATAASTDNETPASPPGRMDSSAVPADPRPASSDDDTHAIGDEPKPRSDGRGMNLSDVKGLLDEMFKAHDERWDMKTQSQIRQTFELFSLVCAERSIETSAQIDQAAIHAFRSFLMRISPDYGKGKGPNDMLPTAYVMRKQAEQRAKSGGKVGLSTATINRHLTALKTICKELKSAGFEVGDIDFSSLRPRRSAADRNQKAKTHKIKPDELRPVFDLPPFVGFKDAMNSDIPGTVFHHGGVYWCTMALYYTGCRRGEIAKLPTSHIKEIDGIPVFSFRSNKDLEYRVKNASSERDIAIPPEMIRLGFLDYVKKIKGRGFKRLFPDLYRLDEANDPGDRMYDILSSCVREARKRGSPLSRTGEDKDRPWDRMIHAIRHGTNTQLFHADTVQGELRRSMLGHSGVDVNENTYLDAALQRQILSAISALPIVTDHLQPREISLFPWLSISTKRPWERAARK
ncbi:MAG: hypothetical protein HC788_09605 [Sphingopyxis sp.]|nr:hypothetical protein [Sphingopyxis sp.]